MRVYIEIGNICNLACSFCPQIARERRQMNLAEFQRVLSECAPIASELYFHLMGEPLLHPELDSFLSVAEEYSVPVCITTNGTLLKTKGENLLRHAHIVKKVSISLQSYESNKQKEPLCSYVGTCIHFAKVASELGIYCVFRLWNLSRDDRIAENTQNEEILRLLKESYPEPWQARYSGYRIGKNTFVEKAEIFDWPSESTASPSHLGHCHGLLDQIAILADGRVVPCCLDAEGSLTLGNIFENSLKSILNSERAEQMRKGLLRGEFTEALCQGCTYARRFT